MSTKTRNKAPGAPQLAIVSWRDADTDVEEHADLSQIPHHGLIAHTLGYLARHDDTGVSIFAERLENPSDSTDIRWRGRTFVPAGMVLSVKYLSIRQPRKPKVAKRPIVLPPDVIMP